jgi:hypothetical protein
MGGPKGTLEGAGGKAQERKHLEGHARRRSREGALREMTYRESERENQIDTTET